MAMTDADKRAVYRRFIGDICSSRAGIGAMTKQDLRDLIAAIDAWISDNATSFLQALPAKARQELSAGQLYKTFRYVIENRI